MSGQIEVICGPMFSGKTEELIRRVKRAVIAKRKVQVFKPRIDSRYDPDLVVSHSQQRMISTVIDRAAEIREKLALDVEVVGIDEVQFLGAEVVPIVRGLADQGLRVIVAGLDQDYRGEPFDPMPQLLAEAEYITKELAICVVCGAPAGRSQRIVAAEERVMVGATNEYEPRCRKCFSPEPVPASTPAIQELLPFLRDRE
ncbi:MAG TPA: thymidine kinase [Myxococcales bacterium]|nr:thymidine kinase [Myxococcales bacterium]